MKCNVPLRRKTPMRSAQSKLLKEAVEVARSLFGEMEDAWLYGLVIGMRAALGCTHQEILEHLLNSRMNRNAERLIALRSAKVKPPAHKINVRPIGLKDRTGREIMTGDEVEFYVTYDHEGHATYCVTAEGVPYPDGFTLMKDKVIELEGEFYFFNRDVNAGSLARRHARFCKITSR